MFLDYVYVMIYILCWKQLLYEGGAALSETSCETYSHGCSTIYDILGTRYITFLVTTLREHFCITKTAAETRHEVPFLLNVNRVNSNILMTFA